MSNAMHGGVIKSDGTLWMWGFNGQGQIGDGSTANRPQPKQIGVDTNWKMLGIGNNFTIALKTDGSLWAWGSNSQGQFGDGTIEGSLVPKQIGVGKDWKFIAVGDMQVMAIKQDGSLWGWGHGNHGRLGLGDYLNKTTPVRVGTENDWEYVSTCAAHTLAIKGSGQLWAWGSQLYGRLGDGTSTDTVRATPKRIGSLSDWAQVSAGDMHSLAVKKDGTLWAWGYGYNGRLGTNNDSDYYTPTKIGTDTNWKYVSAGADHSVGIKTTGEISAWGSGGFGEMGDGFTIDRKVPTKIGNDIWKDISAGDSFSVALKVDNSVYTWGRNYYSRTGQGTDGGNTTTPKQLTILGTNNAILGISVLTPSWNNAPTVTLTSPSNNQTLYENDALNIAGEAYDSDKDQSVTVYYQVNNEPRKVLATNLSQTQISLSKQLTFKGLKLFDGEVAITGVLADGVAHALKVWAVDSEGGQSTTVERTFYVVPNRAPLLLVEPPSPSGIIDVDSFTINGLYEDSDGNQTTVSYRTNGSNAIQVASGVSGSFSFEVKLGSLIVGDNVITVEAVDSYGAKTTKSVKLSKSIVSAPLLTSTARYKITPPTGTASEILVWIQHDAGLTLSASVSMTIAGEQESYAPMTLSNSETLQSGQVEDEFYYAADGAKDSIILRLDLTKSNVNTNEAITLITGVF